MKYDKYFKDVSKLQSIDVYRVIRLFKVEDHELGHAVKKLLLCGQRTGGKSRFEEITEARDTLNRWLEIESLEPSDIDLKEIEDAQNEDDECRRMDVIARNGNDGLHYEPVNLMNRHSCDDEYLK